MKNRAARSKRQGGSTMIEFALSFGFLFSVFAGVFQFGYAYFVYNTLENAVRSGARYASLRVYDSATSSPSAGYLTAVKNMVVSGSPEGGVQPVAPGLTPAQVSVTVTMERNVPKNVTVSIVNYSINAVVTSFQLNGKPKLTFAYTGRFAPP
jgi:Flp pilus assembly protein TadG